MRKWKTQILAQQIGGEKQRTVHAHRVLTRLAASLEQVNQKIGHVTLSELRTLPFSEGDSSEIIQQPIHFQSPIV